MPKAYEELTRNIAEMVVRVSPNLEGAVIRQGAKNWIKGASGFGHQIDVSIEIPNEKLVVVECKRYKSKVTVSDMLILIARIDDVKRMRSEQVTGCFCTTKGYTRPAKQVGSFYHIELNTFQDYKSFAVHIARNTLIKAEPLDFNIGGSGHYVKDRDA